MSDGTISEADPLKEIDVVDIAVINDNVVTDDFAKAHSKETGRALSSMVEEETEHVTCTVDNDLTVKKRSVEVNPCSAASTVKRHAGRGT